MKKLLLLPILLFVFNATAQIYEDFYSYDIPIYYTYYGSYNSTEDSIIRQNGIVSKQSFEINSKGEKVFSGIKLYDKDRNNYNFYFKNKRRKIRYSLQKSVENYSVYQWKHWGSTGKQINEFMTLNGKNFLKERIFFSNNKIYSRTHYFRNDTGRIDSNYYFRRRETTAYSKTFYRYENGKLAETKNYIKGKLKYVRKYDCTPLGKIEKKVEKTKLCVNAEYDKDGNRIEVREYTNPKGKTAKIKYTFKGESKIIIKKEKYNYKNVLVSYSEKTAAKQIRIEYKKGKEIAKWESFFDQQGNIIKKAYSSKGKLYRTELFEFNDKNLKTKQSYFDKKGKKYSEETHEYDSRNLIIKTTSTYNKKTTTKLFEYN